MYKSICGFNVYTFLIFTLYGSKPMVDLTLIFVVAVNPMILAGCLSNAVNLYEFLFLELNR
jgi:hypothetical protein